LTRRIVPLGAIAIVIAASGCGSDDSGETSSPAVSIPRRHLSARHHCNRSGHHHCARDDVDDRKGRQLQPEAARL